jgi:outer membrane protein assembly factor BamB
MLRPESKELLRIVFIFCAALGVSASAEAFTIVTLDSMIKMSEGEPAPADADSDTSNKPRNSIDDAGCLVVFTSLARNLSIGQTDGNSATDVFLFNRCLTTPTVTLVSHQSGRPNVAARGASDQPVISPGGEFVVFRSTADDIVFGPPGFGRYNIFLWTRATDTFTLISHGMGGANVAGDGDSQHAVINRVNAGRPIVAFESVAQNLVDEDNKLFSDVFVNDAGVIQLVSIPNTGLPGERKANEGSFRPDINADGTCIVYESKASNLVADVGDDANGDGSDIFSWQNIVPVPPTTLLISRLPGTTTKTGLGESTEASIDDACKRYAFKSTVQNLAPSQVDVNLDKTDVFHAGNNGDVVLVSHREGASSVTGSGESLSPVLSRDGLWVAHASFARDLAPFQIDPGNTSDVFLFDVDNDKTALVSHNATNPDMVGSGESFAPEINKDGRYVAYESGAKDLDPNQNDGNGQADVFLYNRTWNNSIVVSRRFASLAITGGPGTRRSFRPVVSGNGLYVAFTSDSSDLIADDPDPSLRRDVFLFLSPLGSLPILTARSTSTSNILEWVTPAVNYVSLRTFFAIGACPTTFGAVVPANELPTGSPAGNSRAQFAHGSLVPDTPYCYALFTQKDDQTAIQPGDAPWRTVTGQTFSDASGRMRWTIKLTNTTNLTQLGIGTQRHIAVTNDGTVHSLTRGASGGFWSGVSWPFRMLLPIQGRPPIVGFGTLGSTRTTFVGLQAGPSSYAGRVYAFDADVIALTGGALWYTPQLGEGVQPGASGMFTMFGGIANHILIGARTGAAGSFHSFNASTGAQTGLFNPANLGAINTAASVDYTLGRVYFASLERSAPADPSLWCLNLTATGLGSECWAPQISGPVSISGGPVQRNDRIYVGADNGRVWAFDAALGGLAWTSATCGGGSPIKSYVLADRQGTQQDLYYAAGTSLCGLTDLGGSAVAKWTPQITTIPTPSAPILVRIGGIPYLYLGSSDGNVYQILVNDPFGPGGIRSVLLRSGAIIGAPAFDAFDNMLYLGSDSGVIYAVQAPF